MKTQEVALSPVPVFISYAPEDEALQQNLVKHLSNLQHQGFITTWYDRKIVAGTDRSQMVNQYLTQASIILLLISADFLASDYCYSNEMQKALELHERGLALVIPIILRPVDWKDAPFAHLQSLPRREKAISEWRNRDKAFLEVVNDIRIAINQFQFLLTAPETNLSSTYKYTPISTNPDRQIMLERVWKIWIENFLNQSLHNAVLISLGLREQPDAVFNPWRLAVQEIDQPERPVPPGTSITQVYYDANRSLLILGEPGCGKTTILLQLARNLLLQAGRDEKRPIPVVLNLSSWSLKQLPLAEWLIQELQVKYQVPQRVSQTWIASNMLQLLLDGLDEVDESCRTACIKALNAYREQHGFTSMVVCSRQAEYFAHKELLALQTAVVIQPLTEEEIATYLQSAGPQLEALQQALSKDNGLRELAQTPLMLSVMSLAYQGKGVQDIQTTQATTATQQVFSLYIERVLSRRKQETHYSSEQTIGWLTYLARQMHQQNQSELFLEQMQSDWLPPGWIRRLYPWTVRAIIALVSGLFVGVTLSLGMLLQNIATPFATFNVLSVVVAGFIGGFLLGLLSPVPKTIEPAEVISWSISSVWQSIIRAESLRNALLGGFITGVLTFYFYTKNSSPITPTTSFFAGLIGATFSGLITGAISKAVRKHTFKQSALKQRSWWARTLFELGFRLNIGLIAGCMAIVLCFLFGFIAVSGFTGSISTGIYIGLAIGLYLSPIVGLCCMFTLQLPRETQTIKGAGWLWLYSWKQLIRSRWISSGITYGLIIVLLLFDTTAFGFISLFAGMILAPMFGLVSVIVDEMIGGLASQTLEKNARIRPNQGIWRSGLHSLLVGLIFGLAGGLLSWVSIVFFAQGLQTSNFPIAFSFGLLFALPVGIISGLAAALLYGGTAYLQHTILRFLLWSMSATPQNYTRFLNYAHSRILLRKIGGGYTFIHRQFIDYFTMRKDEISHFTPKRGLRLQFFMLLLIFLLLISTIGVAGYNILFPYSSITDSAHPYPSYLPGHGTLILYDALNRASFWPTSSLPDFGGTCSYINGSLHLSQIKKNRAMICESTNSFGNSAFRVNMTILKGDCGGVTLRSTSSTGTRYIFKVCSSGNYTFLKYTGQATATTLLQGSHSTMHVGLGKMNTIAVLATSGTFTLFINGQKIKTINDSPSSFYASGTMGLVAEDDSNPTEIAYNDACVWEYTF